MTRKLDVYPVVGAHCQEVGGRLVYVLVGTAGRKSAGVAIPAEGVNEVFDDALLRTHIYRTGNNEDQRAKVGRPGEPAGVSAVETEGLQHVVLTIRKDRPGEQHSLLSPGAARKLAMALIAEADHLEGKCQHTSMIN